ncbi:hypothetical protein F0562_012335 [Nyssa sinensis]|uniref:Uncharacterized protein n=1 Tax=Nyssa sinensis TaxID=561372 RepID=A0A5J4ZSG6_9ASTE|nr:hypothetical protein F0562_012335 [Nyssa sinensis]
MEDEDDEFGELYVDVLQRISSSPITPQPLVSSSATRLPNLNPLANHEQSLYGPFNPADNVHQTLVYDLRNGLEGHIHTENNVTHINWNNKGCFVQEQVDGEQEQEMESNGLDKKSIEVLKNSNGWSITEPLVEVEGDGVAEYLEFDVELELKEQEVESRSLNFQQWDPELDVIRVLKNGDKGSLAETAANMETDVCIGDLNLDSKIPRYLNGTCINSFLEKRENAVDTRAPDLESVRGTGTDYDKDSESEDSLKIILNDDDSLVPVRVNENGLGIDENIKAGEYLIIVAENDLGDQGVEEKVLGEDLAEMGDGETMETGHGVRGCGELGNAVSAGIGYQDHSPRAAFKSVKSVALATPGRAPIGPGGDSCQIHPTINYVRPLAAAISGGAPIGPGVVPGSPLVNIDPVAGYGRVDRRPSGIKSARAVLKLPSHM